MREGWQTKALGELCEIELGKTPSRANKAFWDEKRETSNVWLSIADLLNAQDKLVVDSKEYLSDKGAQISKIVRKGTLLVSFKLTLGRLAFAGRDLYTNEAIAALKLLNECELSKEFLFYFLHYFDWQKAAENDVKIKGMTLNKAKLKQLQVHFPSLPEQQRIVAILDEAFEGIASAKANAEKNLKNASEMFQSAYVALANKYDQDNWRRTTVADVALHQKGAIRTGPFGSQLLHGEFVEEGIAVLGIDNVVHNEFRWGKTRCITPEKFTQLSRYQVKPGDVLITIMGTCGRCAVVPDDIPIAINTKHLCSITLDTSQCLPDFLHGYFLHHPIARQFLATRAKGAIMAGLNMEIIKELPVLLPSLAQQQAIVTKINDLRTETQRLEAIYQQKVAALDELKKSLLHQAFNSSFRYMP